MCALISRDPTSHCLLLSGCFPAESVQRGSRESAATAIFPSPPFQTNPHQPDAGEEIGKRAWLRQGEINHDEFLA